MYHTDKRMLEVIDELKSKGKIQSKQQAYAAMGLDRGRVSNIRNQQKLKQAYHFSAENIRLFCKEYKIDVNTIFEI